MVHKCFEINITNFYTSEGCIMISKFHNFFPQFGLKICLWAFQTCWTTI